MTVWLVLLLVSFQVLKLYLYYKTFSGQALIQVKSSCTLDEETQVGLSKLLKDFGLDSTDKSYS